MRKPAKQFRLCEKEHLFLREEKRRTGRTFSRIGEEALARLFQSIDSPDGVLILPANQDGIVKPTNFDLTPATKEKLHAAAKAARCSLQVVMSAAIYRLANR